MPPWMADSSCRPYKHDISLTDAQIETVSSWVDAGAPEGIQTTRPAAGPVSR